MRTILASLGPADGFCAVMRKDGCPVGRVAVWAVEIGEHAEQRLPTCRGMGNAGAAGRCDRAGPAAAAAGAVGLGRLCGDGCGRDRLAALGALPASARKGAHHSPGPRGARLRPDRPARLAVRCAGPGPGAGRARRHRDRRGRRHAPAQRDRAALPAGGRIGGCGRIARAAGAAALPGLVSAARSPTPAAGWSCSARRRSCAPASAGR